MICEALLFPRGGIANICGRQGLAIINDPHGNRYSICLCHGVILEVGGIVEVFDRAYDSKMNATFSIPFIGYVRRVRQLALK